MDPRKRWSAPLRALLALIWITHGLEKFGVKWPAFLAGGTHSVDGMLRLMMEETPISLLASLISHVFLPVSRLLQYPVGALEITIGLALATGVLLPWFATIGLSMQAFFWLGFLTLEWPFQYPLLMLAHLFLLVRTEDPRWMVAWRAALGFMWLYQSGGHALPFLALGGLLLLGIGTRAVSVIALALVVPAFQTEAWGSWPWTYYTVAILHLLLLVGAHRQTIALATVLPQRVKHFVA